MKKLSLLIALVCSGVLSAQSDLVLYNFNSIPQSLHVNPAYPQQTKFYVGLPVLSGFHVHYHNSGFALIDLLETGTDINENFDALLLDLDDRSQLSISQGSELFGMGWKAGNNFWSFGITQTMDYRMDYPVDLLKLVKYGNVSQEFRNTNLNNFDYEAINRLNFYIGFQREWNDKFSLGFRFKYLKGQQHAYAERTKANIQTTDSSSLVLQTDALFRTAGVSNFIDGQAFEFSPRSFLPQNNGFALDLGANFKIGEKVSVSASVLDLGYINWTENTRDYVSEGSYTFDGFEANLSNDRPVESFDQLTDSLEAAFKFEEVDGESYQHWLAPRAYAGVNYHFNEKHALGALYHVRMWEEDMFHDFSVNYQGRVSRFFQFSVNYSLINGTQNNLGGGFHLKLGAVQLYVLSDNVLHAVMYENLQTTNIRVGVNLTWYNKKDNNEPELPDMIPVEEQQPEDDNEDSEQD